MVTNFLINALNSKLALVKERIGRLEDSTEKFTWNTDRDF